MVGRERVAYSYGSPQRVNAYESVASPILRKVLELMNASLSSPTIEHYLATWMPGYPKVILIR